MVGKPIIIPLIAALAAATAFLAAMPVWAVEGVILTPSSSDVKTTTDKLQKILTDKGVTIFARIDHPAVAKSVGQTLRPMELRVFGNPKLGTALMQKRPEIGLDLPLKALVFQAENGTTYIAYADPALLANDFFHTQSPRGLLMSVPGATPGVGVAVSQDGNSPADPDPDVLAFGSLFPQDSAVPFAPFSAERIFGIFGRTTVNLEFRVPGTSTPGGIRGFGAVFIDVDLSGSTRLEFFDVGSQNWAYTDRAGNIAYFTSAEMPLREDLQTLNQPDGTPPFLLRDGTGQLQNEWLPVQNPQPGQALPYEILPFAEMPQVVNPASGYILNANNDPVGTTLDNNPLNQVRPGGAEVLQIIEHDQHLGAGEPVMQPVLDGHVAGVEYAEHPCDRRQHQLRIVHGAQRHPPRAVAEAGGELIGDGHGEPGLAGATWAYDRDQGDVGTDQQGADVVDLALAANHGGTRNRESRSVTRSQHAHGRGLSRYVAAGH